MDQQRFITEYLIKLGFDEMAAKLYITLVKNGPLTILAASKASGIERIKIYRIIDELTRKGLIEDVIDHKRRVLKAADLNIIDLLVKEKEMEMSYLTNSFPTFTSNLELLINKSSLTKVLYYRGKNGIQQMQWNELKSKGESLMYIYKVFDDFVGVDFFNQWANEFSKREIYGREIRTEIFNRSKDGKDNLTHIHFKNVPVRYMSHEIFPLNNGMTIYNNVLAIYNWNENEIFGIEIYNQQIADLQKFFFNLVWNIAKEDKKRDNHKNAIIK